MSEENDEKWRSYALDNRNKITELEKKTDLILTENVVTTTYINRAEGIVKAYQEAYEGHRKKHTYLKKELSELKDKVHTVMEDQYLLEKSIKELKDQFTNNHLDLFPDWINDISLMKEVLQEFISVYEMESMVDTGLLAMLGGEKSGGMKDTIVNEVIQVQHSKPPSKCPYCSNEIKFTRKFRDQDEDIIFEFHCSECNRKIRGERLDSFRENPSEQDASSASARESLDRQTVKNDDNWAFECPMCGFLASNIPVKKVDFTKPWSVKVSVEKEDLMKMFRGLEGQKIEYPFIIEVLNPFYKKYLEEDKE